MHPLAAQSLLAPRPSQVGPFLVFSAVGHVAVVFVAVALNWILAPKLLDLDPKPITASLVRQGKPRDEKLLPRKEEAPAPPPEVKAEAAPPVPSPPVPAPAPAPAKAAPQPGERHAEKKSLADIFNKAGKATKPDDVEGQANGDPRGDAAKAEGEQYYALMRAAVQRNYNVSNTIPESERIHLKALVTIRLGAGGEILALSVKSSGNELFDNAIQGAARAAAPFGPPPSHLKDLLRRDGVTLSFTP